MNHNPADVIAALSPILGDERLAKLDRVAASRLAGLVVVVENLHDPHNGGAALRSSEAVGVLEVRIVGTPLRFSERVTQGCEKWLDLVQDRDIDACAAALGPRGFRLYAAVPGARVSLEELDPLTPAAFLIGNEHEGLTDRARALVRLAQRQRALPGQPHDRRIERAAQAALAGADQQQMHLIEQLLARRVAHRR